MIQYTIRGVSEALDRQARQLAASTHRSLNAVLLDGLRQGLGVGKEQPRHHDLDDLAGTWVNDPEFDRAIAAMDKVDEDLWK